MYCTQVGCRIVRVAKPCESLEEVTIPLVDVEGQCGDDQDYCQCQRDCQWNCAVTGL